MKNFNIMVSGIYAYELWGFFKPYVGVGIGPSYWSNNNSNYTYHYAPYFGWDYTISKENENLWSFSYQTSIGIALNVSKHFDLDVGAKIQNLGKIPGGGMLFNPTGNVIETAMRTGVLYKF